MISKDPDWRKMLRDLTEDMPQGGTYFNWIQDAIEDDIYQQKDAAYFEGMRVGEQQAQGSDN